MLSDIEIAQQTKLKPIRDIAASIGISEDELEPYGRYKAKLNEKLFNRVKNNKDGKLVLVTAINSGRRGKDHDHSGARRSYG